MPSNFKVLSGASGEPNDPNFKNVTLLLHGDGSNGAQNNTFLDGSTNNFTITRNGNTTQGSFTPYGANWSNYFDGSGDYLTAPSVAAFAFGTGDFTIEAWIYCTALSGVENFIFDSRSSASTAGMGFNIEPTTGKLRYSGNADNVLTSTGISTNQWTHVAWVRSGSTLTGYINGVAGGSVSNSDNLTQNVGAVGVVGFLASGYFNGYLSNVRIVKGTAIYTSNFTPSTTPLTAITNTSLLTCQSNRLRDASTNNFTITRNGDVRVTNFAPFAPSSAYSTSANGGSGYFDGTGDYLQTPSDTAFTFSGSLTIEFWINFSSTPSSYIALVAGTTANTQLFITTKINGTGLRFGLSGVAEYATATQTWSVGTWYHVALVRNGTDVRFYVNGVNVTDGTATNSTSYSGAFVFGGNVSGTVDFPGYISNLRIVKGTAVYTAAFTPPTSPVTAITNTSLLLNFTNAGIFDSATINNMETVGNAQVSTSVKKFGTGSMAFDGNGDYLYRQDRNKIANFGTGNFTVEAWIYPTAVGNGTVFDCRNTDTSSGGFYFGLFTSNTLMLYTNNTITSGGTVSTNTWSHIALVRNGSTWTMYLNGTSVATYSSSANLTDDNFCIGSSFVVASSSANYLNGYIDDLRITKGIARYTANFTPPTAAFPNK
jgi:hypothetical protein